MTRPDLLAIGAFKTWDIEAMGAEYTLHEMPAPDGIATLPEALRQGLKLVAYQGHASFGAAEMDLLPSLGIVANYGVGYDSIDVATASARGIRVTNTPDVLTDDVADLAVGLLLARGRRFLQGDAWVRSGEWARHGEIALNRKISGAKVGILGLGRIGREIALRLAGFKTEIHYWARGEKDTPGWIFHADPVALAREVDFLIVALVGGPATQGFVTREMLEALGPDGLFINVSRGTTVDEGALLDALEQGTIAGAGLDVYLNEPNIDPRFKALDNVLLLPHQASGTTATRQAMGKLQRDNIAAFLTGRPLLTPVN